MPFGFISGREEVVEDITRRKLAKTSSRTSKKENLESLKRQIYAKEYGKALKSKLSKQAREQISPSKKPSILSQFQKQIRDIGKVVPRQSENKDRSIQIISKPKRFNPFEHREEEEVYGDTGLTLFDSTKKNVRNTGDFFGI